MNLLRSLALFAAAGAALLTSSTEARADFQDARIQAPALKAPERGSVAGELARFSLGPGDVARGTFSIPAPLAAAIDRGEMLAPVFPSYSPDNGISEWGQGFSSTLALTRWRAVGELDFATDGLTGPWGAMVKGSDGAYYPVGLKELVRVSIEGEKLVARLPDGSRWTFGESAAAVLETARGPFAWYLSKVETKEGRTTALSYELNASGRPFLKTVLYGGVDPKSPEHRLSFTYETLSRQLKDYRSGEAKVLDRRVQSVAVESKHRVSGAFMPRWTYTLVYVGDALSPVFSLREVHRRFASGQEAPTTVYTYNSPEQWWAAAVPVDVKKLEPVLGKYGGTLILGPGKNAVVDFDLDGRPDLEAATDKSGWVQTDDGFVEEPLADVPNAATACRDAVGWSAAARTHARLLGESGPVHVVGSSVLTSSTRYSICDLQGRLIAQQDLVGKLPLGPLVRLVDVNRDHRPDLVRVGAAGVDVFLSDSVSEKPTFLAPRSQTLAMGGAPDEAWIADTNGDGVADIVARRQDSLRIFFGKGGGQFDPTPLSSALWKRTAAGRTSERDLAGAQLVLTDANKDGLSDVLLVRKNGSALLSKLFVNSGDQFEAVDVPAITALGALRTSAPSPVDWVGSGNTELFFTANDVPKSLALDQPGTGLLASIEDGKGSRISLGYARAPAFAGSPQRGVVLSNVAVESVGDTRLEASYTYQRPRHHSRGFYLLGYDEVERRTPLSVEHISLLNEDRFAGILLASSLIDALRPQVEKVTFRTYDDANSFGVPWKRLRTDGSGWRSTEPTNPRVLLMQTSYEAYEDELCASLTVQASLHGTLTTATKFAHLPSFAGHLACIPETTSVVGKHDEPSLDFSEQLNYQRTPLGHVQALALSGPQGALIDQKVEYDPAYQVLGVELAGHASTRLGWAGASGLLESVTSPDGVKTSVSERDPLTDAIKQLTTDRGAESFTQSFRFDGEERLVSNWDSLGLASEAMPAQKLGYRYASLGTGLPALVRATQLARVEGSVASYREQVDLQSAGGDPLAKVTRIAEGWRVSSLTRLDRSARRTETFVRELLGKAPEAALVADLYEGATRLTTSVASAENAVVDSVTTFHEGVSRLDRTEVALTDRLELRSTVNGVNFTTRLLDERSRPVAIRDASGATWRFVYDARDRLRVVTLPTGERHRIDYDDYGRVKVVERDGVARTEYRYDPMSGQLVERRMGPPGAAVPAAALSTLFAYDARGRVVRQTHTAENGEEASYEFFYDGASPTAPTQGGARGLLSAVRGPGYVKSFTHRADGLVLSSTMAFEGFRSVTTNVTYDESDAPASRTTEVRNAESELLSTVTLASAVDQFGRLQGEKFGGKELVSYGYDKEGKLDWAAFSDSPASHEVITFQYDPLTRIRLGVNVATAAFTSSSSTRFGSRGLVEREVFDVGGQRRERAYDYSPEAYLRASVDSSESFGYGFDASGLPSEQSHSEGAVAESHRHVRDNDRLTVGAHHHRFDHLGRVVERDDVHLEYGPSGHVARASHGVIASEYLYDEKGERIAKLQGGQIQIAYLPDGSALLAAGGLVEPIKAGGKILGLLHHGDGAAAAHLEAFLSDARGTRLSGRAGDAHWPSPFGARASHPELAALIDYAAKGWDEDIGAVRMGVRDYDPLLGRFLQPDPLFFDDPARCVASPVECNLYGYAANNPLLFVDPSGTNVIGWLKGAGATVAKGAGKGVDLFLQGAATTFGCLLGCSDAGGAGETALNPGTPHSVGALGQAAHVASVFAPVPKGFGAALKFFGGEAKVALNATGKAVARTVAPKAASEVAQVGSNAIKSGVRAGSVGGSAIGAVEEGAAARTAVKASEAAAEGAGFESFDAFKDAVGPAGEGMHWHHIVEQNASNTARFAPTQIHNTGNLVRVPAAEHGQISAFYSSIQQDVTGSATMTVREWANTLSFEAQQEFGRAILKAFEF